MNTKTISTIISIPNIAKWCIDYTYEQIQKVSLEYPSDHKRIIEKKVDRCQLQEWKSSRQYVLPAQELGVYLQQDGFLDKDLVPVKDLDPSQRPINQNGLGIEFYVHHIKQDVLQCFYFFEEHF
jgi:maltose phosphorylase